MKTAFITGASGGLGTIVTDRFLHAGWKVYAVAHSAPAKQKLEAQLENFHAQLSITIADLTRSEAVQAVCQNLAPLDAVVHLVGGFVGGASIEEVAESDFVRMWELNVKTTFLVIRATFPLLKANGGGAITTIGSKFVLHPAAGTSAYASAKAALAHLTQTVAEEGRPFGIRANCILPSIIRTPANLSWASESESQKWITPEEIAEAILFLSSDAGKGINGALIPMYGKLPA